MGVSVWDRLPLPYSDKCRGSPRWGKSDHKRLERIQNTPDLVEVLLTISVTEADAVPGDELIVR